MILAVLARDSQKDEISKSPFFGNHEVVYSENFSLWAHHTADAFFDLCFEPGAERIADLFKLLPKPVFVNAVPDTLREIHPSMIRVNGWPGFLSGKFLETAAGEEMRGVAAGMFGDDLVFVPDEPGFVSARIVAMIINEAYFALDTGSASVADMDQAMKLGTGYPFGPFEWESRIGAGELVRLLQKLSLTDALYEPAPGLVKKANSFS